MAWFYDEVRRIRQAWWAIGDLAGLVRSIVAILAYGFEELVTRANG